LNKPRIMIIIDALGFLLSEKHHFDPEGLPTKLRLRTVPGFSQSALTSIFTGLRPDRHGLWMMYSFSPDGSPFGWLSILPDAISTGRLWLRKLIDWKLRRVDGIKSYYSLYDIPRNILPYLDLPARQNILMPEGAGKSRTIVDELMERGSRLFIRDFHTPEEESFDDLEEALLKGSADFHILYTASLDAALHREGPDAESIGSHLRWYEERLERILAAAPDAGIAVLGDHGMCKVAGQVDIMSMVNSLGLDIPKDYIPFYDSTMARFRIVSSRAENSINDLLDDIPNGRIIDDEEKGKLGIDFQDNRYGDVIYIAEKGNLIVPSFMGSSAVAGMHGYHPDSDCMYSCLLTNIDIDRNEMPITDLAEWIVPGFSPGERGGSE